MPKKKLTRSEIMGRIHSKDTRSEIRLRKALWAKGYRYRKNYSKVFGKPDIVFIKKKIAIFCDSEFWHGKYYIRGEKIPKNNREYWIEKFKKNLKRDQLVNKTLISEGWIVLRFWEQEILNNTEKCIDVIETYLK